MFGLAERDGDPALEGVVDDWASMDEHSDVDAEPVDERRRR